MNTENKKPTLTMGEFRKLTANVSDDRLIGFLAPTGATPDADGVVPVVGGVTFIQNAFDEKLEDKEYFILVGEKPYP